jgi:hypothetical protein
MSRSSQAEACVIQDLVIDIDEEPPTTTTKPTTPPPKPLQEGKTKQKVFRHVIAWIGILLAAGAFVLAIYSLRLQRWSASNDFYNSCVTQKTVSFFFLMRF